MPEAFEKERQVRVHARRLPRRPNSAGFFEAAELDEKVAARQEMCIPTDRGWHRRVPGRLRTERHPDRTARFSLHDGETA